MSDLTKDRFLPGALGAILLFSVLWWLFVAAVCLFLMWIRVDIFSRWAEALAVGGGAIASLVAVVGIGRWISHRDLKPSASLN